VFHNYLVSILKTSNFLQGKGNQALVLRRSCLRRTSKRADWRWDWGKGPLAGEKYL